ncbi:FtsX-like permease family protein [Streptomyces iconiensis]|uniref:ABC transporter permease n=1 Tax=Streptomyces iconiensis TaxID=1384038 RepID=A0ABT6ZQS1_9ACTN|nr:FtsX-like permease family protein [Streptomyces iconiensis]MDJ1131403.1 ABC transporter permease [Streptomyces iconiensis]
MTTSVQLLAARSARYHRAAWSAVLAGLALTSLLLGALAMALVSTGLGHPRVEARAAAHVVVAGDQSTRFTATPWGSKPRTAHAALTERVRVPRAALRVVRGVAGVRAAVPDDTFPVGAHKGTQLTGRSWDAAALAPYKLREGRAPRHAGEVVVGAALDIRPGRPLAGRRVVGVAEGTGTVWFTAAEARGLAGHPRSVDAIGVLAEPGVPAATLHGRIRHALDGAGLRDTSASRRATGDPAALRVLTGDGRGAAEDLTAAPARTTLLELMGSVSAAVVLVALLVVGSLTAQALHQREPELRLLRGVGATPRQLRAAVGREVTRTAVRAALYGSVAAVPAFLALWAWLRARGAVPEALELPTPVWLFTVPVVTGALVVGAARLAALLACFRTAGERPAHASATAGRTAGRGRRAAGLVLLAAGTGSAGTAAAQRGDAAAAAAGAAALTLVLGCALLGPWIAAGAMRLLAAPLRRLCGAGGWLAAANGTAYSRRLGAAITPVVLVTAFVTVQLSAGATLSAHAGDQAARAQRATLTVTAPGGLTDAVLDRVRAVPGVTAAAGVRDGTVVLARKEAGEPRLERLPVRGVTREGLTRALDPAVRQGSLARLRPGTVAVGADRARAQGLAPGSTARLRFGDGAERPLKVVAVYERSLALGDFLLDRHQLARHSDRLATGHALVATAHGTPGHGATARIRAVLREVAPGARLTPARPLGTPRAEGEAAGQALTVAAVVAIGGLAALTVLSTLRLVMAGRRGEFALLHGVGAARGQLRRMLGAEAAVIALSGLALGAAAAALPLLALSYASAHALPRLPPAQAPAIVTGVVLITAAGTLLPARTALRTPRAAA